MSETGHAAADTTKSHNVVEEDKTYTKDLLGGKQGSQEGEQKILGVKWNYVQDHLVFDLNEFAILVRSSEATKRNIVGIASRFYDPMGYVSPVTIRFKMLFRDLCVSMIGWDEPLSGELLKKWNALVSNFQGAALSMPRCYSWSSEQDIQGCDLFGFCDASSQAYAAIVYIRVEINAGKSVEFVVSKTRVGPTKGITIPRLELLSALLLAKLISNVLVALDNEVKFDSITCFTDSKVALYWVTGMDKEWKPFVQNRVNEIRRLVPPDCWRHCPGQENPADIPSRGISPTELSKSLLWRHGPNWLVHPTDVLHGNEGNSVMPELCLEELKIKQGDVTHTLLNSDEIVDLGCVMDCKNFSKLSTLLRVTAYVIKSIRVLKSKIKKIETSVPTELSAADVAEVESLWVVEVQGLLSKDKNFDMWKKQFGLFSDGDKIWRCKGRLGNANLPYCTKYPALLPKHHHLTVLIIRDAHVRVMHNGVKETLTQVRSKYWVIQGRQIVRQVLLKCSICRRYEGSLQPAPQPPPLPQFRIQEEPAFTCCGVDFAGPLFVKTQGLVAEKKVWICLYTCSVVRAVHLDLVPNMTADAFLQSFRRFTARRGFPRRMVLDNGKTFKSADKIIRSVLTHPDVKQYSSSIGLQWYFNLEKAPWWGGLFERMIKSMKRCLRKTVGRAKLSYDELLTTLAEVEMILNSRPLSYISSDDSEEPLTPSHLVMGRRVLNLLDYVLCYNEDEDFTVSRDVLTKRMKHLSRVLSHFWKRWRDEYLLLLRDCHRYSKGSEVTRELSQGDIMLMRDDGKPRGFRNLVRVEGTIRGADGLVRGATIRVPSKGNKTGN